MISQESIIKKLKEESKVYNNFGVIMEKADSDGYLTICLQTLKFIFQKEMTFAVSELKKMKENKKNIDIKQLLETNIYIFKENIKLILNNCVDQIWGIYMQKDFVENFILKEVYKGKNSIIEEADEDNFNSENKSQLTNEKNFDEIIINKTKKKSKKKNLKIKKNESSNSKIQNIDIIIPDKGLSSDLTKSLLQSSSEKSEEENRSLVKKRTKKTYSCQNSPKNELVGFKNFDYTNESNKFFVKEPFMKKIKTRPLTQRNKNKNQNNKKKKKLMNFNEISKYKKNKKIPSNLFSSNNHIKISININNDKNKKKPLTERSIFNKDSLKKIKSRGVSEREKKKKIQIFKIPKKKNFKKSNANFRKFKRVSF